MSDEPIDEIYEFRLFLWQKARMDKAEYDICTQDQKDKLIEMFIFGGGVSHRGLW